MTPGLGLRTSHRSPGQEIVPVLTERASLVAQLRDPEITLARAAGTYILFKRKRLSEASERGYRAVLDELAKTHAGAKLRDLEPPDGALLLEDFLAARWGHRAPRTYNKSHSVLSDFCQWHVARGTLRRDPMELIERAKTRPVHRSTFTDAEVTQILTANTAARDQIALRLLLFFGIRKGALRGIRFEHFNVEKRELTIFTKGGKIQTLQIVDGTVWDAIAELREPGHHYLLPKRVTRNRTPPQRKALNDLAAALVAARLAVQQAADDDHCVRELADVLDSLRVADARTELAVAAASTRVRLEPSEPIGEHGGHLWWYACLARAGVVAKGATAGRKLHSARHTAIQRVLDKTGNVKAAQALAGHSSISTTGDTYTDWSARQQAETMREVLA